MSKEQTLEYLVDKAARLSEVLKTSESPSERHRLKLAIAKTQRRIKKVKETVDASSK